MPFEIKFKDPNFIKIMSKELQAAVPKAIDASLNNMAFDALRAPKADIPKEVKTTNNFIKSSIAVNKATNGKSEVGIMDRVKFAELLVEGGERDPLNSKYIAVPIGAKGANGRAKKSRKPRDILNQKGYFLKTIKGIKGIWGVWKGHISLMYKLVPKTEYEKEPYIDWEDDVKNSLKSKDFETTFINNLKRILKI
jgi:hypothetical protein